MIFDLAHIDNGIELQVRKIVEEKGYWPDQTNYFINDNPSGFESDLQTAINEERTLIKVFGPGSYIDREELIENNIIVSRISIEDGDIGFSSPIDYEEYIDSGATKYRRVKTEEGTKNISYEIRYVCKSNHLDQIITNIILKAFSTRKFVYGKEVSENPNSIENTAEGFWVLRNGDPVDLSGSDFIERVHRFKVMDVCIEETETIYGGIVQVQKFNIAASEEEGECKEVEVDLKDNTYEDGCYELGCYE